MNIRKKLLTVALAAAALLPASAIEETPYIPSDENLKSRQEFADAAFGIFIHWGIYSMFGQGEWFLNADVNAEEYAKAARGFYPAYFNAKEWVDAIEASGAKYICITSRHHDGFSMWDTAQSDFNIVKGTPFGRDVLKELADECHKRGIRLHFYYSHLDWTRPDYPTGRTGLATGRPTDQQDWPKYYDFMNKQLTELLTGYGPIGAIWFDGFWDHDEDAVPFDWQLRQQYDMIHNLQPGCLVGNNHHEDVLPGEDIQIFERDVPGQNTAGYSGQAISRLPLETCQTMNGMWGYKIKDQNYKSVDELVQYLVTAAGKGANLLLNVGPQPSGELPATAVERMKGIGEWLRKYGETIYATTAPDFAHQSWGTATRKGDRLYLHVMTPDNKTILVPTSEKVVEATEFDSGKKVAFSKSPYEAGYLLHLPEIPEGPDFIITLKLKQ